MFSLLFMLFMMVQTTKVELQPVQQSIETTQSVESIDNVGYTRRSINQKTQVRDKFLDTIRFNGSETVGGASVLDLSAVTSTIISGNMAWKITDTPAKIYIPTQGTYNIQGRVFISASTDVGLLSTFFQKNGTTALDVFSAISTQGITIPINLTENLVKGDYINIYFDNESADAVEISIQLSFIKTS